MNGRNKEFTNTMAIIHDESAYTENSTQDHLANMDRLPDEGIPDVSHPIDDLKASDAVCDILRSHLIFGCRPMF